MMTRPQSIRLKLALVWAALGVTAGPAAAASPGPDHIGRVCPPSSPNCSPE